MRAAAPQAGSGVVFNFDNADIYEVIRVMGEILKINYIIDPRVKGAVNIHTSGQISSADVFPIFQSILRLNGATAVKRDGIYEIVPLPEAKKLPVSPSSPQNSGKPASEERYLIQILPLKYIPVTEVSKMIKPFLSDGADIVEHPPSNILIIGDLASNVKKSMDIINLFDIDVFTDLRVRIYPVLNADVVDHRGEHTVVTPEALGEPLEGMAALGPLVHEGIRELAVGEGVLREERGWNETHHND